MTAVSGNPKLTLGSITTKLLEESEGIAPVQATMPPANTFMAAVHKHPCGRGGGRQRKLAVDAWISRSLGRGGTWSWG